MRMVAALGFASALTLSSLSPSLAYAQSPCDALPKMRRAYAEVRDFDLERIADVDMSRKRLEVVVLVEDGAEPFLKVQREVLGGVRRVYARHGVDIVYSSDFSKPLAHDRVMLRVREMAGLPPVCVPWDACALFAAREMYLGIESSYAALIDGSREEIAGIWSDTIAHEVGHLLTLYHLNFVGGSELTPDRDSVYNLMLKDFPPPGSRVELVPMQRRIIHSFLSKGAAYRARYATVEAGIKSKLYMDSIGRAIALREEVNRLENECAKR